ncbi:MAG: transcriptional regulator [Actinobacteria bacterium]|nr:transcriptional regulator [Actinomycetota bacterium]
MELVRRKLVTIITEASLERKIAADIRAHGIRGYTGSEAWGEGFRGVRSGEWEGSRNVRIDTVCDEEAARDLVDHLAETYYSDYAMIVLLSDVEVTRPLKF